MFNHNTTYSNTSNTGEATYVHTYFQDRRDFMGASKILRGLNTHLNPTLEFYDEELFTYKCCYILYIFYKMNK